MHPQASLAFDKRHTALGLIVKIIIFPLQIPCSKSSPVLLCDFNYLPSLRVRVGWNMCL